MSINIHDPFIAQSTSEVNPPISPSSTVEEPKRPMSRQIVAFSRIYFDLPPYARHLAFDHLSHYRSKIAE